MFTLSEFGNKLNIRERNETLFADSHSIGRGIVKIALVNTKISVDFSSDNRKGMRIFKWKTQK